jgi:hypothetical protein
MPWNALSPVAALKMMATAPFANVLVVQVLNRLDPHWMALAATPDSISVSDNHLFPLVLVKNNVPVPPAGTVNEKFNPTFEHPEQLSGVVVPLALLMINFGSIPLAKAIADPNRNTEARAHNREIFISFSC